MKRRKNSWIAWMLVCSILLLNGKVVYAGNTQDKMHRSVKFQTEKMDSQGAERQEDGANGQVNAEEQIQPVQSASGALQIMTPHALVMEVTTGTILYEKNADVKIHPASVTKVMTMLLIFEAIEQGKLALDTEVVTSAHAKSMGGSQVFLEEGEIQTAETMLKCIVIASGNDAAVAMAEQIGGTEEGFVASMNEKAKSLGMVNTHFVDCCGLTDSTDHYTTARDVAIMSRELLLKYPQVVEYSDVWMEDITHVTRKGSSPFTLTNTNKLLRAYEGCDGLKTGSTSLAKYCLSATARRNNIRLVAAVMTAPDSKTRFAETAKLLNYGFSQCSMYHDEEREALPDAAVRGAVEKSVPVRYESDFSYLSTENEDFTQIERQILWEEKIQAPLEEKQQVGVCVYMLNGKEIGRVPIVTERAVEKAGYADRMSEVWECWML